MSGPAGARAKPRLVLIDPAKVRDARSLLEATFGHLALFLVLDGSLWPLRTRSGKRRLADIVRSRDRLKVWARREPYDLSPNPQHCRTIFARSEHGFASELVA